MDWQETVETGTVFYMSGETASVVHQWNTPGTYDIKVKAILDVRPDKASEWSESKVVRVVPNDALGGEGLPRRSH
jgi:hypothetical protein